MIKLFRPKMPLGYQITIEHEEYFRIKEEIDKLPKKYSLLWWMISGILDGEKTLVKLNEFKK